MTRRPWTEAEAEYEMEVRRPGIEFEMNREYGNAEQREIDRRVEHARADGGLIPDCCDHLGRDEHGCWDCYNTGHTHAVGNPCYPETTEDD